jgi:hypothetical protein
MLYWQRDSKIGFLTEVTEGDLIKICWLSPKLKFGVESRWTPRIGEVFQCIRKDPDGILVARPDGSRSCLPITRQEDICIEFLHSAGPPASTGSRALVEDGQ